MQRSDLANMMGATSKIIRQKEVAKWRFDQRTETKKELAGHAISALAQLGYAQTSMRDIASQSGRSIGALNYYFENKADLICYCVQIYKNNFVNQIDQIITQSATVNHLINNLVEGLVATVEADAVTHRLWYDIRSQSLFEEVFRDVVTDIEGSLIDLIGRFIARMGVKSDRTIETYYLLDNCFRFHLQLKLANKEYVPERFRNELYLLLRDFPQS